VNQSGKTQAGTRPPWFHTVGVGAALVDPDLVVEPFDDFHVETVRALSPLGISVGIAAAPGVLVSPGGREGSHFTDTIAG
jgi:hypothetical protein